MAALSLGPGPNPGFIYPGGPHRVDVISPKMVNGLGDDKITSTVYATGYVILKSISLFKSVDEINNSLISKN